VAATLGVEPIERSQAVVLHTDQLRELLAWGKLSARWAIDGKAVHGEGFIAPVAPHGAAGGLDVIGRQRATRRWTPGLVADADVEQIRSAPRTSALPEVLFRMSLNAWCAYCSAAASIAAFTSGIWSARNSSVAARVPQYGQ